MGLTVASCEKDRPLSATHNPQPATASVPATRNPFATSPTPARLPCLWEQPWRLRASMGLWATLHGSQGCSTYVRRYLIGHFREPLRDLASSNFDEPSAIFGGRTISSRPWTTCEQQYKPSLIGVATTCLAETIGDECPGCSRNTAPSDGSGLSSCPTWPPSRRQATRARTPKASPAPCVRRRGAGRRRGEDGPRQPVAGHGLAGRPAIPARAGGILRPGGDALPDYSDTLDGPTWSEYHRLPQGGTPWTDSPAGRAAASIEFSSVLDRTCSPGPISKRRSASRAASGPAHRREAIDSLVAAWNAWPGGRCPRSTKSPAAACSTVTLTDTNTSRANARR